MLTTKEHPTLALEVGHEIRLLMQKVKIIYNEASKNLKIAKGVDAKQRIYYFVSANGPRSATLDFSDFKSQASKFVFVLNLDIAPGCEITLPHQANSYIIRQSHSNFRVLNNTNYHLLDAQKPDYCKKIEPIAPIVPPKETLPLVPVPINSEQRQAKKYADYTAALDALEHRNQWNVSRHTPRPYQLRAMREYLLTREANRNAVFGLSTGVGKTYLFATIAQLMQEKVLVIVPLLSLLEQTKEQFAKFAPNLKTTIWDAKHVPDVKRYDVFVITLQTLSLVYSQVNFDLFDVVVIDEAHNCLSEDRVHMVKQIAQSRARISAFTATPWLKVYRSIMSEGLNSVYQLLGYRYDGSDSIITRFPIIMAIDAQANAPLVTRIVMPNELVDDDTDDSDTEDTQRVSVIHNSPKYHLTVADVYLNGRDSISGEWYRGQRSIVFCSGINHAIAIEGIFDAVLTKSSTHQNTFKNLVEHLYLQKERDAFYKKYKKGYEVGTYWEGDQKNRMMALVESKARRRMAAELIDPTGIWRRRYADNVKNELAAQGIFLSPHEYDAICSKFRVAKAVYSKGAKIDAENLDNKKCQKIINKFRLGGYLLLTGADKLTEGFDNPEVSLIIFARSTGSDRILCQGVGRGLRTNPNDPHKICTVIQIQVNKNAYGRYRYAYEIISTPELLRFAHGNVDECRRQKHANVQGLMPIPIEGSPRYDMIDSPEQLPTFFFEKVSSPKLKRDENKPKKGAKRAERPDDKDTQQTDDTKRQVMDAMNATAMHFLNKKYC